MLPALTRGCRASTAAGQLHTSTPLPQDPKNYGHRTHSIRNMSPSTLMRW